MSNYSTSNAHKSLDPPLPYPGATPDAERAQKPALPEPPYKPYAKNSGVPEPPYKPYAKKSGAPEPPHEPYKRHVVAGPRVSVEETTCELNGKELNTSRTFSKTEQF
jgi:hypothetical protein